MDRITGLQDLQDLQDKQYQILKEFGGHEI